MTETPQKGVLSGRPHVLNPAWQLPSAELASSSQAGLTPQIGKGCVDHVCRADLIFAITGAVMMADSPPGIAFEDIP
jgi:hypothetical protein